MLVKGEVHFIPYIPLGSIFTEMLSKWHYFKIFCKMNHLILLKNDSLVSRLPGKCSIHPNPHGFSGLRLCTLPCVSEQPQSQRFPGSSYKFHSQKLMISMGYLSGSVFRNLVTKFIVLLVLFSFFPSKEFKATKLASKKFAKALSEAVMKYNYIKPDAQRKTMQSTP